MTHPFTFRPGTLDQAVFQTVTTHNEYRLPAALEAGQIVIDIGMHIGSFSYAALARGATHVYAFEPEIENYQCAVENLRSFGNRVHTYNKAVWRSDRPVEQLFYAGSADRANTSGGGVVWANEGPAVQVIAFDDMLQEITNQGQKRIHLLKIDCEGSEFPILLTSRMLHAIDNICGEFHEVGGAYDMGLIPERAAVDSFDRFTITELADVLKRAGFSVDWQRHDRSHMGLFFASRGPGYFAAVPGEKCAVNRRFASWSHRSYGHETPPGVVSRDTLRLDGYEGSHLGAGWHTAEQGFRWTREQAQALLHCGNGQNVLEVALWAGPEALGPVTVTIEAAGQKIEQRLSSRPWQQIRLSLPPMRAEQGILPVTITVDRTRSATQLGAGDARDLGVAVRSLNLKGRSQAMHLPLSSVCNPKHWNDRFWRKCLDSMAFQGPFGKIAPEVQHRKLWEWVQGIAALARLGCITPSAYALG
ncbi:MAG TPA: FkbM family methyltransferase, partial [Roseiflexaceae bacterium]|nr:FkbM family methyltransferase [Roseiflexaceae bacterium]